VLQVSDSQLANTEWVMVAASSKVATAQSAAVRTLDGSSSPHQRGKNTADSALCSVSEQSIQAEVVYGQGTVWNGVGWP
jgi:hypothetical protein